MQTLDIIQKAVSVPFIFAVLVPIAGLTSCKSDAQPDSWTLTAPQIVSPEGQVLSLREASLQPLAAHAKLVFDPDETAEVEFDVRASCEAPGSMQTAQVHFSDVSEVPLLSLWPEALLTHLDAGSLEKTKCSFHFVPTNANGSTHEFDMVGIQLMDFGSDAGPAEVKLNANHVNEIQAANIATRHFNLQPATATNVKYNLVCENFTNERELPDGFSNEKIFQQLASGELPAALPKDPRKLKTRQTCHLLTKYRDGSDLDQYAMTPNFVLLFPLTQIEVEPPALGFRNVWRESFDTERFVQLHFQNTSETTQLMRFPIHPGKKIYLQGVAKVVDGPQTDEEAAGRQFTENLVVNIQTNQPLRTRDGFYLFELASGEQASIDVQIQSTKVTMVLGVPDSDTVTPECLRHWFAGFTYAFDESFQLQQYRDYSKNLVLDPVAWTNVTNLDTPVVTSDEVLPGWLPHAQWIRDHDPSGSRPTHILGQSEQVGPKQRFFYVNIAAIMGGGETW